MLNLDSLPLELKFEVFSHLIHPLSSHKGTPFPTTYAGQREIENLPSDRVQLMQHPYCQLAATCDSMRDSVEAYCLHLIKGQTHPKTGQGRTKLPKPPKDNWRSKIAKAKASPRCLTALPKPKEAYRNVYLRSVYQKCVFCGMVTTRRAAFNRFMWCDKKCDIEHYGRLIVSQQIMLHCDNSYSQDWRRAKPKHPPNIKSRKSTGRVPISSSPNPPGDLSAWSFTIHLHVPQQLSLSRRKSLSWQNTSRPTTPTAKS